MRHGISATFKRFQHATLHEVGEHLAAHAHLLLGEKEIRIAAGRGMVEDRQKFLRLGKHFASRACGGSDYNEGMKHVILPEFVARVRNDRPMELNDAMNKLVKFRCGLSLMLVGISHRGDDADVHVNFYNEDHGSFTAVSPSQPGVQWTGRMYEECEDATVCALLIQTAEDWIDATADRVVPEGQVDLEALFARVMREARKQVA